MSEVTRVAILHYHLKRGGVTRVVETTLRAFAETLPQTQFAVLAGEVPDSFAYRELATEVEGLHYSNAQDQTPSAKVLLARVQKSAEQLLGAAPDVWHIHNHSLGKNTAFAGFISQLAETGAKILLHMHDFAEDGRPENYRTNQIISEDAAKLYPDTHNVHYAVLNGRDQQTFQETGVAKNQLHLLSNPIEASQPSTAAETTAAIKTELNAKQLILYPVRAVRRKNFGEMLLWSALAPAGTVFASTLNPTNENYQQAYQQWIQLSKDLQLPVCFGIGEQYEWGFENIFTAADAILTTSIAEGFGLAFLEPWLFGKSITGRDIPDITTDFKDKGLNLDHLYTSLPIPAEWIDTNYLSAELERQLTHSYRAYGIALPTDAIQAALNAITPEPGYIDFAGLDEKLQMQVIRRIAENPENARQQLPVNTLQFAQVTDQSTLIETEYKPAEYAQKLQNIYNSLSDVTASNTDYLDPQNILAGFLKPERFRLLRT